MQKHLFLPASLLTLATITGCSSMQENPRLNEARNSYTTAQNNPKVTTHAAAELKLAGDALDKANMAAKKGKDEDIITHLAYVAKQRVAAAEETAKQKEAESIVANANAERSEIQLQARTEEARRAQQMAEEAQRQAAASQQSAEALNREAMTSQQQAEAALREAEEAKRQIDLSQQQAREAELRATQLEAQMKELNAKKTDRGMVITLGDVLFDTNKAQLKSGSKRSLEKLAAFLKKYPDREVQIEGYTDSTGSADYNLELSERRANAVRTALMDMGISSDRVTTRGYGKDSPVASNDTPAGRQMNRRVEIVLSDDDSDNVSLRSSDTPANETSTNNTSTN